MKKLALPVEDAALLQEKLRAGQQADQPTSPGGCELIEMAVNASVQRTRARRYLTAASTEQVLTAEKRWDEAREDDVLGLVKLLETDPAVAVAVARLRRTGHGCRCLIARPRGGRAPGRGEGVAGRDDRAAPGRADGWEAVVRAAFDVPSRALAKERALLLEGPTGSNWQRYERMHELAFHRAYGAFVKGREREAETGVAPGVRNEANEAREEGSTPEA